MKAPRRWLDADGGATVAERRLLRSAASDDLDPPPGAERAVWVGIAAALASGVGGAGAVGGGAAGAAGSAVPGATVTSAGGSVAAGAGATSASVVGAAAIGSAAGASGVTALGASSGAVFGSATATTVGVAVNVGILKSVLLGIACAGVVVGTWTALTPNYGAPEAPAPAPASGGAEVAPSAPGVRANRSPGELPPSAESPSPSDPEQSGAETTPTPSLAPTVQERSGDVPFGALGKRGGASGGAASSAPAREVHERGEATAAAPGPSKASSEPVAPPPGADERASQLREESSMLAQAREAMRRGDAGAALGLLEQSRARFPGGVLVQEREALAIEALYRSGQRGAAAQRAAAFLRAYPLSPHATRVQSFAQ